MRTGAAISISFGDDSILIWMEKKQTEPIIFTLKHVNTRSHPHPFIRRPPPPLSPLVYIPFLKYRNSQSISPFFSEYFRFNYPSFMVHFHHVFPTVHSVNHIYVGNILYIILKWHTWKSWWQILIYSYVVSMLCYIFLVHWINEPTACDGFR